jgi:hypothetical protein
MVSAHPLLWDEAPKTGQIFAGYGGIGLGALSMQLSKTTDQSARRAQPADVLRLSALQDLTPLTGGVPFLSLQLPAPWPQA